MIYRVFTISDDLAAKTLADPESIHEVLVSLDDSPRGLSLEKSWHGLHFLLTGKAWAGDPPLNFLAAGGEVVGDVDVGYGPARILRAPRVKLICDALERIPENFVDSRLDPKTFDDAQIYPPIWKEPRENLVREYTAFLQALKAHIRESSDSHQALLLAIQ